MLPHITKKELYIFAKQTRIGLELEDNLFNINKNFLYNSIEINNEGIKKLYDKRQDIAKKDQRREAEKNFKIRNLY